MSVIIGWIGLLICILLGVFAYSLADTIANSIEKRVIQNEKLNLDDFKKNQEYYRDIIFNYSPALLSYIDEFELDLPRDIIGTLMVLEKKNYLKIEDGILVNNKKIIQNVAKLTMLEKYLLTCIKNKILKIKKDEIIEIVQKEGLKKQLLKKEVKDTKYNTRFVIMTIVAFVVLMIVLSLMSAFGVSEAIVILCWVWILFIIWFVISFAFNSYKQSLAIYRNKTPFYRTKKGEELNKMLEGLKLYLKDYSNMKDKNSDMFYIWDDYLIYSIIFHQNDVAMSKYLKYIDMN